MKPRLSLLLVIALVSGLVPLTQSSAQEASTPVSAGRETEAVVMNGLSFPSWATLGDITLEAPSIDGKRCQAAEEGAPENPVTTSEECTHNQYEDPDAQTSDFVPPANATPVDRILGYAWNGESFEQIPFQVDEMFTRYLSNNNSGFSLYSETDQHTSYAFDREGFRWLDSDPNNPCLAQPRSPVAEDPVPGLDTDDELVFMARDASQKAPVDATLPEGIAESYEVAVTDPANQTASFVYVMKAEQEGPRAEFDASNGYVRYERDADSNLFLFSESSYDNYGATEEGPWYDPKTGVCNDDPSEYRQHRPGDQATITTPRYRFRYEGRWLMTELNISDSEDGDWTYGPDVVDQWKARAFQQRPGGETPCCGYEEEVNNWGGSSILMGERSGPVRTIRETWGADSGTNVVRREIFYRDEIRLISFLRVHVIPPADGIYAQWDYNAGMMTRYYNPNNPDGVAIDGKNDDIGNTHTYAGSNGVAIDPDGEGPQEPIGEKGPGCPNDACVNNDIDVPDPVFSGVNAGLNWEQISGPYGTLVSRTQIHKATPGTANTVVAVPYYRDDACFDDGTGSNPGPHIDSRDVDGDEPSDSTYTAPDGSTQPRECWDSDTDAPPPAEGDPRYYQGSIGTNGVHILLIADSDNANMTVPVTEIDGDQRIVVLPPQDGNVGELYGRGTEKPLVAVAVPESRPRPGVSPSPTTPGPTGSPTPTNGTPSPSATPQKRATTLEFTGASAAGGQYSDTATLQARLTDAGNAVSGEEVTFELIGSDGSTTWNATTDGSGLATKNIDIDRAPGSYQLTARFAGDDSKLASADESSFAIDREDTNLTLQLTGKNKPTLTATLVDADSSAGLQGRDIEFFADNVSLGTATTNANGVATHTGRPGNRTYVAKYAGDTYYLASSAQQRG